MPSRAEVRAGAETALRALSIALLAALLWMSMERGRPDSVVSARSANLESALMDWTTSGVAPDRILVQLDNVPSPVARDWLAALRGAGSSVSWRGDVPAIALSVLPVASPRGGYNVLAAAPGSSPLSLADEIGPLDTAEARAGGAQFSIPAATGPLTLIVEGSRAQAQLPDSVAVGRILLFGNAGWESKFVTMALEEDGWSVDASMHVAPGVRVTQGPAGPIDTARYAAVVALDASAASRSSEIARYVATGGGLVLAAQAGSSPAFAALRAGAPGRAQAPAALSSDAVSTTLQSLPVVPIATPRSDAIALDRRGAITLVAARRHVAGRVLQHGYVDTWRWRMSGGENSVEEHRSWWTRAVSSAAFSNRRAIRAELTQAGAEIDDAPVARLVAALGPSSSGAGPSLADSATSVSLWWLFVLLLFSLLVEWASRRLRGAR